MLINIDTGTPITTVPFSNEFQLMRTRLGQADFDAVIERINKLIDNAGAEIATAGWLPGRDWAGTPFQPIYEKAAQRNEMVSGKLFGLCVWYAVMERPERWGSGRYEKDGRDIGSRTYFRFST